MSLCNVNGALAVVSISAARERPREALAKPTRYIGMCTPRGTVLAHHDDTYVQRTIQQHEHKNNRDERRKSRRVRREEGGGE